MEQRMDVAMLLDEGLIYSDILERTGASSATISRVNRCLHYGADGYRTVIPPAAQARGRMSSYDFLAGCYDRLTYDVDYSAWADYIEKHFTRRGLPGKTVWTWPAEPAP